MWTCEDELASIVDAKSAELPSYILKQTGCLSVWTKIGQCLEDSSSHCLFPVELVTNRAGRPGQLLRGVTGGAISIKEILGKTGGPASNQTKIQFFFLIIFIIEHIKKTRIFLKKKIETK